MQHIYSSKFFLIQFPTMSILIYILINFYEFNLSLISDKQTI